MAGARPRYGPMVSTLGAIVLGVSVFLPWYGVSFTAGGVAAAQHIGDQVVSQYGNAQLQSYMSGLHTTLSGLAGHQFAALSAHEALKDLNIVLLILAGLATLIGLLALAGSESSASENNRPALALLGAVAAVCVLYRIVDPPTLAGDAFALSLREGAWLALLGSVAIVAASMWPRDLAAAGPSEAKVQSVWSELSGWTPES